METYLRYGKNVFKIFEYTDNESGQETVCSLELFCYSEGRVLALVMRDYPRAPVSVSTSAPSLKDAICKRFKIAPAKLVLMEHCTIDGQKHPDARIQNPVSPFYWILFTDDGPQWQPLSPEDCMDMTLQIFKGYEERNP